MEDLRSWPFENITPEEYAALSDADRQLLEVVAEAYVAEVLLQRDAGMRPGPNEIACTVSK